LKSRGEKDESYHRIIQFNERHIPLWQSVGKSVAIVLGLEQLLKHHRCPFQNFRSWDSAKTLMSHELCCFYCCRAEIFAHPRVLSEAQGFLAALMPSKNLLQNICTKSEIVELLLSLLLFPVMHAISGNLSVIWGLSCTNFYSTSRDLGQTVFAGQSEVVKHVATLLRCALGDVEDDKFWGPIQNSRKAGKNTICCSMWRHGFGKQLTTTPDLVCNTEWNQVWPVTNSWCINQY